MLLSCSWPSCLRVQLIRHMLGFDKSFHKASFLCIALNPSLRLLQDMCINQNYPLDSDHFIIVKLQCCICTPNQGATLHGFHGPLAQRTTAHWTREHLHMGFLVPLHKGPLLRHIDRSCINSWGYSDKVGASARDLGRSNIRCPGEHKHEEYQSSPG